jgi:plastocyanin domain-containing protein
MMTVKKIVAIGVGMWIVAAFAASGTLAAQAAKADGKKVQVVKLTVDDKGYVVTPDTVVKGVPVRMEVDLGTVTGCARTVVINAVNVKKTVKEGQTTIEFTPTKTGKVEIVCGMNMVRGSFTVGETK